METFSALLAICAGNSPVPGDFPTQRAVTRSFDVYFDLRPNKRLSKQLWGWWFETQSLPLWRHRNAVVCHEQMWWKLHQISGSLFCYMKGFNSPYHLNMENFKYIFMFRKMNLAWQWKSNGKSLFLSKANTKVDDNSIIHFTYCQSHLSDSHIKLDFALWCSF